MSDIEAMPVTADNVEKENVVPVIEKNADDVPAVVEKVSETAPSANAEESAVTTEESSEAGVKTTEMDSMAVPDIRVITATPEVPVQEEKNDDGAETVLPDPMEDGEKECTDGAEKGGAEVEANDACAVPESPIVDAQKEFVAEESTKSRTESLEVPPVDMREEAMPAGDDAAMPAPVDDKPEKIVEKAAEDTKTDDDATVVEEVSTMETEATDAPSCETVTASSAEQNDTVTETSDETTSCAPVHSMESSVVQSAPVKSTAIESEQSAPLPISDEKTADVPKENGADAKDKAAESSTDATLDVEDKTDDVSDVIMVNEACVSLLDDTTTESVPSTDAAAVTVNTAPTEDKVDTPKAVKRGRTDEDESMDAETAPTPPPCKAARESVEQGMQTLPSAVINETANVITAPMSMDKPVEAKSTTRRLLSSTVARLNELDTREYLNATVVPLLMGAMNDLVNVRPVDPVEHVIDYLRMRRVRTLDEINDDKVMKK